MNDDLPTRSVTIPVRVVKGVLRMRNGLPLPKIAENSECILIVPADDAILTAPDEEVRVCPAKTELLVGVRFDMVPPERQRDLHQGDPLEWAASKTVPKGQSIDGRIVFDHKSFVSIRLNEPLMLVLSALGTGTLKKAECYIPSLDRTAISVNQAYTFISELFEPHRAAHTGNVFDIVYLRTKTGWQQLEEERQRLNAEYETRCRNSNPSLFE